MRRTLHRIVFCWALAASGVALAQPVAGGVQGVLKDPNGKTITGLDIPISVKNVTTGQTYTGNVLLTGQYAFKALPAGDYELNLPIQCCMYRSFQQKDVRIASGQTLKLDLPVQWGINLGTIGDDPGMLSNDLRARSKNVAGPAPRTADGHPDLSGMWDDIPSNTPRPKIQLKPWAQKIDEELRKEAQADPTGPRAQGPAAFCLPQSATPTTLPFPYELIQTPDRLIQLTEALTPGHREIFLDGRAHPDPKAWNPAWYGHSVGHWDGDTLVIDSVGFNEITPGYSVHSEKLHVVERVTRPTRDHLVIDITAEDPEAWSAPYHTVYEAGLVTGDQIYEWVCAENNKAIHFGQAWKGRP
jgi:hypothetical protein